VEKITNKGQNIMSIEQERINPVTLVHADGSLPQPRVAMGIKKERGLVHETLFDKVATVGAQVSNLFDRVSDSMDSCFVDEADEVVPVVAVARPGKVSFKERIGLRERAKKVGALVGGVAVVFSSGGLGIATAQSSSETDPLTPEIGPAVSCIDDILVGTGLTQDIEVDGTTYGIVTPQMSFNNPIGNGAENRVDTDALSTPIQGETIDEKYADFEQKLCTEPLLLAETASVLARVEVGGVRLSDENTFLQRFLVEPSDINDLAREYVPSAGSNAVLTGEAQARAIDANLLMQNDAEQVIDLLRQMLRFGEVDATAGYNLGLAELLATNQIPDLELKPSYDGEFITYVWTDKASGCVLVLGVNTGDGRMTVLGCQGELPQLPETPVVEIPDVPETPPETPEEPPVDTPPSSTTTTTTAPSTTTTTVPSTTTTTAPSTTTTTVPSTTTTTVPSTTTTTAPSTTTTVPSTPTTHGNQDGPPGGVIIENQNTSNNDGSSIVTTRSNW
jgi:hypothetical protein